MPERDWTAEARQLCLEIHSANPAPHAVEHVRKLLESAYAAGQADAMAAVGLALHSRSELTPAQRIAIAEAVRWFLTEKTR